MHRKAGLPIMMAVLVLALTGISTAQEHSAQGFVFAAPGGASPGGGATLHLGGGFEKFLKASGFAVGGDIGYLGPTTHLGDGFGLLELDGGYHFNLENKKVTPFVSGGYSLGFRNGHFNAVNIGGGANVWMNQKLGLRLELRDVVHPNTSSAPRFQFINVRIGLTFR